VRLVDLAQRADAIVVLGSGRERGDPAWGADQPTGVGLERQRYAARLAKASGLPVLTSGGLHYGTPPSEAQLMAGSLHDDFGVAVRWKEAAAPPGKTRKSAPRFCCRGHQARGGGDPGLAHAAFGVEF
jgi:hypothetical protein